MTEYLDEQKNQKDLLITLILAARQGWSHLPCMLHLIVVINK